MFKVQKNDHQSFQNYHMIISLRFQSNKTVHFIIFTQVGRRTAQMPSGTHTHTYEAQGKSCVHTWLVGSMACTEVSLTEWKLCHFNFIHCSQEDGEHKQRDRDNSVKEPKHGLPWKWEISGFNIQGVSVRDFWWSQRKKERVSGEIVSACCLFFTPF